MNGPRNLQLWVVVVLAWIGLGLSVTLQVLSALGLNVIYGLLVLWPLAFLSFGVSSGLDLFPKRRIYVRPYFPWNYLRDEIGVRLTWISLIVYVYGLAAFLALVFVEKPLMGEVRGNRFFHNGISTIATAGEIQAEYARATWGFSAFVMGSFLLLALVATGRLRRARVQGPAV
jgi:hypothetical protein